MQDKIGNDLRLVLLAIPESFCKWSAVEATKKKVYLQVGQNLLIPILVGWTSIYKLFWGSLGPPGFDPWVPHKAVAEVSKIGNL